MEEERKKKKNKKKKSKQSNKTAAEAAVSVDQIVNNGFELNRQGHVSETGDIPNDVPNTSVDLDKHHQASGSEGYISVEAEKLFWLNREASLEEQIKQLQNEKEAYISKEVDLGQKISQLQNEKDQWLQKEASLEEQIEQLQMQKDAYINKEADLGLKILQLQNEKYSWLQKEVGLEEKVKQLEKERESWAQKEDLTEETNAALHADNTTLRSQVMELEGSQKNLLQDNQQLTENITGLHSQIQNSAYLSTEKCTMHALESEELKSQMLAAPTMVEKLLSENAKLVEKLNAELDQRGTITGELSSSVGSDPMVGKGDPAAHGAEGSLLISDPMDGRSASALDVESSAHGAVIADPLFESGEKMKAIENVENTALVPNSETIMSEGIVQIPLDENEFQVAKVELEDSRNVEVNNVPISDAPLIGAPFRLISFVARYVSGADLVNKNPANSGR